MKPKIRVDVVSDVVCPWCYIGKRRLEKAVENLKNEIEFEIEYHPFELNPTIPASGVNQREYLTDKFGGEERYEQLTRQVSEVAAQEGLTFDYERQSVSPNTRKSHALVQFAKSKGLHRELVEVLFNAYFTSGVDLSKDENLVKAAEEAGLDHAEALQALSNPELLEQVEAKEKEMAALGISGVPFYILNNRYGVSGAQASDVFERAFREITGFKIPEGETCDPDKRNC